jgi:energy-coupling factor transport system ATP-binding protein
MRSIEINNLHFRYGESKNNILNGISLKIKPGEVISIAGSSGCGKSTLCYCICGIIPHIYHGIIEGEVLIFNKPVDRMNFNIISTSVGMVFQNYDMQLFSPTVEDEIAFGPENLCLEREEIAKRIEMSLKLVNMEKYRFEHPENLSGGEKQLVAIASVLSMNPGVLILDESLSQIDREGRKRIMDIIRMLKDSGKSVIMIDHSLENSGVADHIYFLKEGKLEEFHEIKGNGDESGFYKIT